MRRIFGRALLGLAITTVVVLGADNSIGTWNLNVAKSHYTPGPIPLKSLTAVRESTPDGVKATLTGERTDGTAINGSYTAKYDGSAATVTGTGVPYDTISIKQVDANTFTSEAKKTDGKYHSHGRTVISKDGKTLTTRSRGTDADGKAMSSTLVYDKQ
jgi:hypothetical protein